MEFENLILTLVLIFGLGFIIGFFIMGIEFTRNPNTQKNNGLMKISDCKTTIQPQPPIICKNYTIKDNYYYCNIDDVEIGK